MGGWGVGGGEKGGGEKTNLPFAPRRGRVQAKRRTQGMLEIQRNNTLTQQPTHPPPPTIPLRFAILNASPSQSEEWATSPSGAVHNHRHSGESRNPVGPGSGVQSETPSLNPL